MSQRGDLAAHLHQSAQLRAFTHDVRVRANVRGAGRFAGQRAQVRQPPDFAGQIFLFQVLENGQRVDAAALIRQFGDRRQIDRFQPPQALLDLTDPLRPVLRL